MKKFYFALCMTLLCGVISTNAQGPFRSAITPEINYPAVSNIAFRSDNTSAYSYGNLNIGGNLTDLYVFTWDRFINTTGAAGSGLAIRQSTPFAQSYNPSGFPVNDAASIEAVILQENNTFISYAATTGSAIRAFM